MQYYFNYFTLFFYVGFSVYYFSFVRSMQLSPFDSFSLSCMPIIKALILKHIQELKIIARNDDSLFKANNIAQTNNYNFLANESFALYEFN